MSNFMTTGQAAKQLGINRDQLTFAIRYSGAPEPVAGKVGNRRIFSPADIEVLREWFAARRDRRVVGHA